jgi:hypothetical protein
MLVAIAQSLTCGSAVGAANDPFTLTCDVEEFYTWVGDTSGRSKYRTTLTFQPAKGEVHVWVSHTPAFYKHFPFKTFDDYYEWFWLSSDSRVEYRIYRYLGTYSVTGRTWLDDGTVTWRMTGGGKCAHAPYKKPPAKQF